MRKATCILALILVTCSSAVMANGSQLRRHLDDDDNPATIPLYINCGARRNSERNGITWLADRYSQSGWSHPAGFFGNAVFSSMRVSFSSVRYRIPLEKGESYDVKLHFRDARWFPGKSNVDITVAGDKIRENLRVDGTVTVTTIAKAGDGFLRIIVDSNGAFATLAAIEVLPIGTMKPGWVEVESNADLTARHEACFVQVGQKAYLLAGRKRGDYAVDIYNPRTNSWSKGTKPPINQLHHTQCVVADDKIWIVSSWTGGFPMEINVPKIYIYDPATDSWSTKDGLPEHRQRGGAASVLVGRKIFVSHGNRGGHETGDHAVTLGWLDYYDIDADEWVTDLPDAPHPRDHTGGALVNGRICVSGGRDGGEVGFFNKVILETDCYDISEGKWYSEPEWDIPQGRAGSSYGRTCDGKLMVAGGEGFRQAWDNVDVFDGNSWSTIASLNVARHGSGLAVDCECNQIHIASGSGALGGNPELHSVETLFPQGVPVAC